MAVRVTDAAPTSAGTIDVRRVLDMLPVGKVHLAIFFTLFLVQIFEGVSQLILAYAATAISGDLGLEPRALGLVFAVSVGGAALGAFLAGMIGDVIGPKLTAVLALAGLGLATAAISLINSLPALIVLRLIGGLCSGAGLVNVIALAAQFAPFRRRASLVTFVVAGFPTGAMLTGVFMAALFPPDEWRSAFVVTGLAALIVVPLAAIVVPESLPVLLRRKGGAARVQSTMLRFGQDLQVETIAWGDTRARARAPIFELFRPAFLRTTLMLSAVCIVHLVGVYFLSNWMPMMLEHGGASNARALNLTAIFNLGGIVGVVAMGWLMDHLGARKVLSGMFLAGAGSLLFLSLNEPGNPGYMPVLVLAGMAFLGGTGVLNALPSLLYPATLRATGGGWAIGTGHMGSAAGPLMGGFLLQGGWQPSAALMAAAALPALAFVLSLFLRIPAGSVENGGSAQ